MEKYGNAAIIQTTKSKRTSPPSDAESEGLGSNPSVIPNLSELQFLLSRNEILPAGLMGDAQEMLQLTELILLVLLLLTESTGRHPGEKTKEPPPKNSRTLILPLVLQHSGPCYQHNWSGFQEDSCLSSGRPPVGEYRKSTPAQPPLPWE